MERVVLVGFMAAGKTTVGRELALALGWTFVDSDDHLVAREGRSVRAIFAESGEAAFRVLEQEAMDELLSRSQVVIATGGGWAGRSGWTERLPPGSFTVWLDVRAGTAVERAKADTTERPLLLGEQGPEAATRLLSERRPHYARADDYYDTEERHPTELVQILSERLQDRALRGPRPERTEDRDP